jgi:ribonuclease D
VAEPELQAPAKARLITEAGPFEEVIDRLGAAESYALDTEFHRERTYWPRVALVQVAWPASSEGPAGVALIDPQAVDLAPLAKVLTGPGVLVAHAADQDLEVLERACGCVPTTLFDTQIGAGFTGQGSASLAALSATFLGRTVSKGDRLTDWSRRPLTASQLDYAAADVEHLLELADAVRAALIATDRLAWAEEECRVMLQRRHGPAEPNRAWWKLRDSRQLRGATRGVAQELAAWREQRAQDLDVPVRSVLPDLALQSIIHSPPPSAARLAEVRGLDGRYLRDGAAQQILEAIDRGRHRAPPEIEAPPTDEVSKELRPAVALAAAWVAQLARDERIDAALLATRSDLVAYLQGDPAARLSRGWRGRMVGDPLRELVAGRAALAFDGHGGLLLEARSGRPLSADPDPDPAPAAS